MIFRILRRAFSEKRSKAADQVPHSDIVSCTTEPCSCGRTHLRLHGIHGRLDDMLIIRGVNVFPSDIEMVVRKNNDLTGEYRLVVTEEMHLAKLTVEIEHAPHVTGDAIRLAERFCKECQKTATGEEPPPSFGG